MTKHEAAIISAYTGVLCCGFSDLHKYAEKALGRPILSHEFGNEKVVNQLKEAVKPDFISLCENLTE